MTNIFDANQVAGKVHRDFGLPPGPYGLGYAPACGPAPDGHIPAYQPTDAHVTCGVCLRIMKEEGQ